MKELRVDRILEGTVGFQEYKNLVNPGSHNLEGSLRPIPKNSVNPDFFQRYASKNRVMKKRPVELLISTKSFAPCANSKFAG